MLLRLLVESDLLYPAQKKLLKDLESIIAFKLEAKIVVTVKSNILYKSTIENISILRN